MAPSCYNTLKKSVDFEAVAAGEKSAEMSMLGEDKHKLAELRRRVATLGYKCAGPTSAARPGSA